MRNDHAPRAGSVWNGRYNLAQSFSFAFKGICYALRHERNLRIHFAVAAYALYFAVRYYDFSRLDYALLLMMIGLVITCEMFNTAIEKTVDIGTPAYNGLAKIAKDVAAGAVLVSSIASVAVGSLLFWSTEIFGQILADLADQIYIWIPLALVTAVWIVWPRRKAIIRRFR